MPPGKNKGREGKEREGMRRVLCSSKLFLGREGMGKWKGCDRKEGREGKPPGRGRVRERRLVLER